MLRFSGGHVEHWLFNSVPSANGLVCGSCWWMCPSHQGTQALLRQVLAGFPSMQPDPLAHPYALARWRAEFFLKLKPHLFSWCHRAGALIVIPCSASRSHISRSVKSALSLIHSRNIGSTGARQDFRCPPIWKLCRMPSSRRVLTWYTHTRLTSKRLAISVGRSPCSIAFSTLSRKSCEYACIAYSFRKKTPYHIMNCLVFSQRCSHRATHPRHPAQRAEVGQRVAIQVGRFGVDIFGKSGRGARHGGL